MYGYYEPDSPSTYYSSSDCRMDSDSNCDTDSESDSGSEPGYYRLSPLAYALWDTKQNLLVRITANRSVDVYLGDHYKTKLGNFVAIDCECVGVGPGRKSALARVSVVNYFGVVYLDVYVRPNGQVTDWRTLVSGITPELMQNAISYKKARELVEERIDDRVLVGHSLSHDLGILRLSHLDCVIEDISKYDYFRSFVNYSTPGLRFLTKEFLDYDIQQGSHSLVEDAQATMALFRIHRRLKRTGRI